LLNLGLVPALLLVTLVLHRLAKVLQGFTSILVLLLQRRRVLSLNRSVRLTTRWSRRSPVVTVQRASAGCLYAAAFRRAARLSPVTGDLCVLFDDRAVASLQLGRIARLNLLDAGIGFLVQALG